jgi:hypothetical protein
VVEALGRLRRLGQSVKPDISHVDEAVEPTRALLEAAGVEYKVVGDIAVIHHGYQRFTADIDVLVERDAMEKITPLVSEHGFRQIRNRQLQHVATGVLVDVLVEGEQMARVGAPAFPDPSVVAASPSDARVVGFAPLLELKLHARRAQDIADVVELLKRIDEAQYIRIEAALPAGMRPQISRLWNEALEELEMARRS